MIRIARLIPFFTAKFGGPYNHIMELTFQLQKLGVDTSVFTTSNISQIGRERTIFFEKINSLFKVYRFDSFLKFREYRISLKMFLALLKETKNFDIFHSHAFRSFQEDISSIVNLTKNKPFVITPHGGISINYNYSDKIPKMIHDKTIGYLKKRRLNPHFIAVAKNEIPIIKKCGIDDSHIHYIPHGVNTEIFKPVDSLQLRKKLKLENLNVILYVGRIDKIKGLDKLIKILNNIIKKKKDVKLMIIGGNSGYLPVVKSLINKYNLFEYVIITGFISKWELPKYYSLADLVIYPSKQEIFGHVVAEAGACGKVVIGSDIMGPSEIIIDGKTGYISNFEDLNDLSDFIIDLLDDRNFLVQLGRNALNRIKEKYSWKKAADAHLELYKHLLNLK